MAKIYDNIITDGLSGKVGRQIVFRKLKGQTIVARQPAYKKNRKRTTSQINHSLRFREAVIYAKAALADANQNAAYAAKAAQSPTFLSAYNVAVADYLNAPVISNVNTDAYTGQAGETIIIMATDDFKVDLVTVEIRQNDESLVEKGAAQLKTNGLEWEYVTQSVNSSVTGSKVIITAYDLPGNMTVNVTDI